MKTRMTVSILATLFAGALAHEAAAWTWLTCTGGLKGHWASHNVPFRASLLGFPAESDWATALQSVVSSWNTTPANVTYSMSWNELFIGEGNGESEVWWSGSISPPAVCYTWYNDLLCQIVETDVVFKNTVSYTTSTDKSDLTPYGGSNRPFRTTAIHEFGHAQGLGHTTDTYSVMGQDWDHIHANGSLATAYPGEDAFAGSVAVYGFKGGAHEDLAVAHWRHTGASGGYSAHDRARVLDAAGGLLSDVGGDEPVYLVAKGQQVKLQMSYENMGKSTHDAQVGFYLSSNDYISHYDTFLGAMTVNNLGLNTVYTSDGILLTIPDSVAEDTIYWLGAIIDYEGTVAEVNEGNNKTYTAIQIQRFPDLEAVGVSSLVPPGGVVPGQVVPVARTIQSVGGPFSGSFTYKVRLSLNTSITAYDPLVANLTSATLGAVGLSLMIPSDLPAGTYHWGLVVDAASGETATANNTVAGGSIVVNEKPDVEVVSVKGPKHAQAGKKVKVNFKALASHYGGSFTYEIRLSENTVISAADPLVASGTATGSGKHKAKFTMPALPAGKYYWGVRILAVPYETETGDNALAGNRVKVK
ncbi:MAG: hypothetical protein HY812_16310 [Planctomycetes bacterium]|nr:hypothetical protein [Planctomycetota bacterium]